MEMTWMFIACAVTSAAFWVLVAMGVVSLAGRGIRRRGLWVAEARAAQRFARGEIDAATFRGLRDDLRSAV